MKACVLFGILLILIFTSCQREFVDLDSFQQKGECVKDMNVGQVLDIFNEMFKEKVSQSASGIIYPSYFGGMYINESNKPVVMTTNMEMAGHLREVAEKDEVIVKLCTYSYQELSDLDNYIRICLKEQPELFDEIGICSFGIYESMNRLEVAIVQSTPEKIDLFRSRIVDSPMLIFRSDSSYMFVEHDEKMLNSSIVADKGAIKPKYELFPGSMLFGKGRLPVIIAFRMKSMGEDGFITSGHVAQLAGKVGDYLTLHGDTVARILSINMHVDAAFCNLRGKKRVIVNDMLLNSIKLQPRIRIPHERRPVELGAPNMINRGVITKPKVVVRFYGSDNEYHTVYTAAEATYPAQNGHSGSVVYDEKGIFGIHLGTGVGKSYSYFNHIEGILYYFGGELY